MNYKHIHENSIVIDAHSDIPLHMYQNRMKKKRILTETHIPLLKRGGVNIVFIDLFEELHPEGSLKEAMIQISELYGELDNCSDGILIKTKDDLNEVLKGEKIGFVLSAEGLEFISNEVSMLRVFYELGLRCAMLTWNWRNYLASGTYENGGLSLMGKEAIKEMNRLGIIVDVSHLNEEGFWDIVAISTKPIIASHSNAKKITNHVRNLTDDQIKAIAKTGGVIGLNSYFTSKEGQGKETLETYMDHMEYMIETAGEDHVGLGFDFNMYLGSFGAVGLEDCTCIPNVTKELINRGYKEETVKKILGGNFVRVLESILP